MYVARWEDWSGRGLQHVVLSERADAIIAEAVCIVPDDGEFAARYRVRCDPGWRCRELDVEIIGAAALAGGISLALQYVPSEWNPADAASRPRLA